MAARWSAGLALSLVAGGARVYGQGESGLGDRIGCLVHFVPSGLCTLAASNMDLCRSDNTTGGRHRFRSELSELPALAGSFSALAVIVSLYGAAAYS